MHKENVDRNPSFGLKVSKQGFLYNCFTCGIRGRSLVKFIEELQRHDIIPETMEAYKLQNAIHPEFHEYGKGTYRDNEEIRVVKVPGEVGSRDLAYIQYHRERGVKLNTLDDLQVRYIKKDAKVIFPVYDWKHRLKGYVEHKIKSSYPKYSNEVNKSENLYLEWLIRRNVTCGIVVEGIYDAIVTYQHLYDLGQLNNFNVVAMLGSKIGAKQVDLVSKYFNRVILYADNDEAGIMMEDKFYQFGHKKIPAIYRLRYMGGDPADVNIEKFKQNLNARITPYGMRSFA
jgi:5S rRNA maturation endonuclease (ribonuclease M5)